MKWAATPAMKRMEQAARSRSGDTSPDAARLQKQMEETQKQLGNPTGTPEDTDKLNKELSVIQRLCLGDGNAAMLPSMEANMFIWRCSRVL